MKFLHVGHRFIVFSCFNHARTKKKSVFKMTENSQFYTGAIYWKKIVL
jgi:hypothetical protein